MADDLEKKRKIIDEIEQLYKKLGQHNPFGTLKPATEDMRFLLDVLRDVREEVHDLDGGVNEMVGSWRAMLDEVKANNNSINASKRSLSSLADVANKLKDHYKGINTLSVEDLNLLKKKYTIERDSITQLQKSLSDQASNAALTNSQRQQALNLQTTINHLLTEQDSILNDTEKTLDETIERHAQINKELGFYPKALSGLDRMLKHMRLPNLGVSDALEETHRLGQAAGVVNDKFEAMPTFLKQLTSGAGSLFTKANLIQGALTILVDSLHDVDKGAGDFAKSMNITYTESLRVRGELGAIAGISGDAAINSERLQESLGYINQQLGTNGKLSQQDLITFTKLREQSGLTNEQLFSMQKYTMVTGGTLEDNITTFQATSKILSYQNKVSLNTKQLMVDMGSVSNQTKLSIEGGAAGLAKAAVNAKLMGGNLEQVAAIADQLLNFESSIEAELSAELLTGKDITLEKARQAALNNDLATVASEITNQIGSAAEYSKMNRIQQEAMAKAVGMNANQLADVLVEQEAIRAVGKALSEDEQRAFEAAKAQYGIEQASKMLKEGQLDKLVEQQSIQDRFNQTILKLKDLFIQLAEPVLQIVSPFMDLVSTILPLINVILQPVMATLRVIGSLISGIVKLITLDINGAMSDLSPTNLFKGFTDLTTSSKNQITSLSGTTTTGNDVISHGEGTGYGNRTLLMGKDAIQLNNQDTVIAGTGLFKGNQQSSSTQDNSALIAEIRAMRNELNNRPVVVHSVVKTENNDVLASATNQSNRKTGYSIQ